MAEISHRINIILGLWLSSSYIYIFSVLRHGGKILEPNAIIANVEFCISIAITLWFILCFVLVRIRRAK